MTSIMSTANYRHCCDDKERGRSNLHKDKDCFAIARNDVKNHPKMKGN